MRKSLRFLLTAIVAITPVRSIGRDRVIPAGALLQCSISDPSFSSKTAELNDPVMCEVRSSRWLLPSGTYLVGRLEEYRDPGHFIGKGWMQLSFDRIVLSDRVVPLTAKVVHAPDLPVDRKGRIRGHGHPVRDAVEWSIPVLWPMKVVSLPMRGPTPTLKSESRLTLKVMEDVILPDVRLTNGFGATADSPWGDKFWLRQGSMLRDSLPQLGISPSEFEPAMLARENHAAALASIEQVKRDSPMTILILKDGTMDLANDYWFEDGQRIRFDSVDGSATRAIRLSDLDYARTVRVNEERGATFAIHYKKSKNE
jgi:hypothetical protein